MLYHTACCDTYCLEDDSHGPGNTHRRLLHGLHTEPTQQNDWRYVVVQITVSTLYPI